jgi:phage terminase large subunit-like protein
MEISAQRLSAKLLGSSESSLRIAALAELTDDEARYLGEDWNFWAREEQLPPTGDWRIWLFMGGRGSGKTRAGAEWIAQGIREGRSSRVALISATHHDARAVMIEGESGLLSVCEGATYEPSNRRVLWPDGAVASVLSADEPDSIRGHQFDAAWCDELCKWPDPQEALDMILMALRLGDNPRMMITTTPRNIAALKNLIASPGVKLTRSSTRANAANLADSFIATVEQRYGGTRLGRQELDGDRIEDNENALWQRGWIERHRVRHAPALERIVVAIDPPAGINGDECGIVVAGRDGKGEGYVLADRSAGGLTPNQWASRAMDAFAEFSADAIVAEANQGGEMVRSVLSQAMANAPVRLVHATRDKRTRALPIAALTERGLVHHVGAHPELEDQMCTFDGGGPSPDRMDAMVWALSELFPLMRRPEPRVRTLA